MRKFVVVFLLSAISLTAQNNFFITQGKEIKDPEGKTFLIKGINLGNWLVPEGYMFKFKKANAPRMINDVITELIGPAKTRKFWIDFQNNYITFDDIKYIKRMGANTIRVPFNYKLFSDETYLWNTKARGFELIDRLLNWCKEVNLAVILDMHCAPGGQTGDNIDDSYGYPWLFKDEESQAKIIKIWTNIAKHYSNEKIILGYDLMNEPIAHYFEKENLNGKLVPLYKKLVSSIRSVDTNHIIILGGAQWNTNFSVFGKPFDNKLVYEFHKYWMPPVQEEIQQYVDFQNKYNVPVYMGESGENDDEWVSKFRTLLDSNSIGWTFWPYKKMDNTRGPVNFDQPDNYDLIIDYAESDRSTYKLQRENKPNIQKVINALSKYLANCKSENCFPNKGYIKALGFSVPTKK